VGPAAPRPTAPAPRGRCAPAPVSRQADKQTSTSAEGSLLFCGVRLFYYNKTPLYTPFLWDLVPYGGYILPTRNTPPKTAPTKAHMRFSEMAYAL